jgi:hypothetical protein
MYLFRRTKVIIIKIILHTGVQKKKLTAKVNQMQNVKQQFWDLQ